MWGGGGGRGREEASREFLRTWNCDEKEPFGLPREVVDEYRRSLAFYAVTSYLLGLGDRHLGNILILPNGSVRNVDFEYVFGDDPKFYDELRLSGVEDPDLGSGWESEGSELPSAR